MNNLIIKVRIYDENAPQYRDAEKIEELKPILDIIRRDFLDKLVEFNPSEYEDIYDFSVELAMPNDTIFHSLDYKVNEINKFIDHLIKKLEGVNHKIEMVLIHKRIGYCCSIIIEDGAQTDGNNVEAAMHECPDNYICELHILGHLNNLKAEIIEFNRTLSYGDASELFVRKNNYEESLIKARELLRNDFKSRIVIDYGKLTVDEVDSDIIFAIFDAMWPKGETPISRESDLDKTIAKLLA